MNQETLKSKQGVVSEIADKFKNSSSTVVAEYRGLSVAEITELRRSLRSEGVEMKVYKNTLASRAADEAGYGDLKDSLTGPNAMAFGADETAAARILAKFAKDHKALVLKGGIVEGKVLDAEGVMALAKLPNREGMLSMLLSVLTAPVASFARVVQAVSDNKTDSPEAPAEVATEEAAPASEAVVEEKAAEEAAPVEEKPAEEAPAEEKAADEAAA